MSIRTEILQTTIDTVFTRRLTYINKSGKTRDLVNICTDELFGSEA